MAQGLTMDRDQVDRQLKELTALLDLIDSQAKPISDAKERQHGAVWSEIDACRGFAASYAGTIGEFEVALKDIRDSVGIALINLRDSADSLANQDETLRADYAKLVTRLDLGAPTPAPATGGLGYFQKLMAAAGAGPGVLPAAADGASSSYSGGTKLS